MDKVRIDKWLWAARFYKTRSLASEDIAKGRVQVNGIEVKPARDVRSGDSVVMRHNAVVRTVVVRAVSDKRGAGGAAALRRNRREPATASACGRTAAHGRRAGIEPGTRAPDQAGPAQARRGLG